MDEFGEIIYNEDQIRDRVSSVAKEISRDFKNKQDEGIIFVCVLKGAEPFFVDLTNALDINFESEYIYASSYKDKTVSSGQVSLRCDYKCDIAGKHIVIVDDIAETGLTMNKICEEFQLHNPASVSICVLLDKRKPDCDLKIDYKCFDCPNEFIVGYGLDYAENYRDLPYITSIKSN